LGLLPQSDLREGGVEVDAVHERQVLGLLVDNAFDRNDVVVNSLRGQC
jgi:hypothetical protein